MSDFVVNGHNYSLYYLQYILPKNMALLDGGVVSLAKNEYGCPAYSLHSF